MRGGESPEDALYRELHEEIGLKDHDVQIVGSTRRWLRYSLRTLLVFVEVVATDGPIDPRRKEALSRLAADAGWGVVLVSEGD